MLSTLNSVCTVDDITDNYLILEVMPNNFRNGELQFYNIGKDRKDIKYINFRDFNDSLKRNLRCNRVFYITFCGISNKDCTVPEYLYLTFNGDEVDYDSKVDDNNIFLKFKFKKNGYTIEEELNNLFVQNIGVFIQSYN